MLPSRRTPDLDPAALAGYRRVPGYGKVSFFNPFTGERRSSRRFYNPAYSVDDPRREITDYQYYRLRRNATAEQRGITREKQLGRTTRERTRRVEQRERSRETGLPLARVQDLELQRRLATYETHDLPSFDPRVQQVRRPGGPLARILEELGLRPPDAPWAVGSSESTEIIPSLGNSPAGIMAGWRSQHGMVA